LVSCPHLWPHSSFRKWVDEAHYRFDWACQCDGKEARLDFSHIAQYVGK